MKHETSNGYIVYSIESDEVIIENVKVFEQRKGTGTQLINFVKCIASEQRLPVTLYAEPQDDTITDLDLTGFYTSNGFELHPDDVDNKYFIFN
jgi:hypothetical protein